MNKKVIGIILAVLILGGLGALLFMKDPASAPSTTNKTDDMSSMSNMNQASNTNSNAQTTTPVTTNKVDIKEFAYSPATITVKKGTTVTWTNQDSVKHNVAPTDETNDFKASELLGKGESYSATFNTVGTFDYICTPHPYMKGKVVVTE